MLAGYGLARANAQFNMVCIICNSTRWLVYNARLDLGYYHHPWCPLRKITTTMSVLSPHISRLNMVLYLL
jgi:hypothetical protein